MYEMCLATCDAPNWHLRRQDYHQWLSSQYGLKKLTEHIWLLVGVASTCSTMPELRAQMAYKFGKVPLQLTMFTDPPRVN